MLRRSGIEPCTLLDNNKRNTDLKMHFWKETFLSAAELQFSETVRSAV